MKNRQSSRPRRQPRRTEVSATAGAWLCTGLLSVAALIAPARSIASTAPAWMHALVSAQVPAHDEKANAVVLYSETVLTVQANGKIKRNERMVYKILRPDGASHGVVRADFDSQSRVISMHGWCIPASGKDYETSDRDSIETTLTVDGGELIHDLRSKLLRIPAAVPGNIVGYEVEQEARPFFLTEQWSFQATEAVREARFTLQLPPGWNFKSSWINHAEATATQSGPGQWTWVLNDLEPVKLERNMPPWHGIAGRMVVALITPDGKSAGFQSWREMGAWYLNL